jgi:hypothetical protein
MIHQILSACVFILLCSQLCFAQRITESLDNWTLGSSRPTIQNGTRGDGTNGSYHYLPVGTSAYYYEVQNAGEGSITFWIYDPAKCLQNPDPGYGTNGPRWGLQNPNYHAVSMGIYRPYYFAGCQGYVAWSTAGCYSCQYWFKDGIRGADSTSFAAGWYKWKIDGTQDEISFTLHDVDYDSVDGPGYTLVHGNVNQIYNSIKYTAWSSLFGYGWKGVWLKGDISSTGIEDICVDVVAGTGVFSEFGSESPVLRKYNQSTWGGIKSLYK